MFYCLTVGVCLWSVRSSYAVQMLSGKIFGGLQLVVGIKSGRNSYKVTNKFKASEGFY